MYCDGQGFYESDVRKKISDVFPLVISKIKPEINLNQRSDL